MGVIVPIVTSILFGILFPTGDITLDIKFMQKALTFSVGKTSSSVLGSIIDEKLHRSKATNDKR